MLKYLSLEIQKLKVKKYSIIMLCIIGVLTLIGLFFFYSVVDVDAEKIGVSIEIFSYDGVPGIIDVLMRATMIIVTGQLINKILIDEYETKTINIVFTSSVDKKKIIITKLVLIWVISIVMTIVAQVIAILASSYFAIYLGFVDGSMATSDLRRCITMTLYNDFCYSFIALIPMYFGLKRRNSKVVNMVSIIVLLFTTTGFEQDYLKLSNIGIPAIPMILALLGIVSLSLSVKNAGDYEG